jgi:histidinol-phosphatase
MSPRLKFAIEAVRQAGDSTLDIFRNGAEFDLKQDSSPVTLADTHAEQLLRASITQQFPNEAILGEEQGATGQGNNRWIIDPIDGTKSFIAGVPLYATLLSFEENGEPILGVCYFPALKEMLYAERGSGTFFNGKSVHVSQRSAISGSILACGGPKSMVQHGRWEAFDRMSAIALTTRTWSDAYGHALVATGRADAMIDPIVSRWDVSPMKIIVEEAGGRFTDFRGQEAFLKGDFDLEAISSNGVIHKRILEEYAN